MITRNGYSILKDHCDKLILGGHRYGNGLEPIRDTYKKAFGVGIGLLDVYQTEFSIKNNPLNGVITLVGPFAEGMDEYPVGIISSVDKVFCVDHFTEEILKGITENMAAEYVNHIYELMDRIIGMDAFYGRNDTEASKNPYIATVRSYPLYFTYYHAKDTGLLSKFQLSSVFESLLEKFIVSSNEDIDSIMNSLSENKYCTDPESIYRIMSCNNTVPLFY